MESLKMEAKLRTFPATAGVWLFPFARELSEAECATCHAELSRFLKTWKSHQKPIYAKQQFKWQTLLVVITQCPHTEVGGCAKDELIREVKATALRLGCPLVPNLNIVYKDIKTGKIKNLARETITKAIASGDLTPKTPILHKELVTWGDFTEKLFIPAGEYWIKSYFKLPATQ
ncbi:hypothetical protein COTS27_00720 [Spirochaetota bacterium]|nr:hypothetical protein COTS27_00720 [Spirochaetota bacterium]